MKVFKTKCRAILISVAIIVSISYVICLIQSIKKYKIISYGDSITASFKWQPFLEEYYGQDILNLGIGSTCLARHGREPIQLAMNNQQIAGYKDSYPSYVKDLIIGMGIRVIKHFDFTVLIQHTLHDARLNSDERLQTIPNTTKIAFVMGGTNDAIKEYKDTDIVNALEKIYKRILSINPNTQIIVMTPPHNTYEQEKNEAWEVAPDVYRLRIKHIRQVIAENAENHGFKVIHLENCGIDSTNIKTYTFDGIHPNDEGGELIGKYIIKELQ